MVAVAHANPATRRTDRGPHVCAIQPRTGAPIGVPPTATATRKAMTLPRIAGSLANCMKLLVDVVKVTAAAPISTSAAPKSQ